MSDTQPRAGRNPLGKLVFLGTMLLLGTMLGGLYGCASEAGAADYPLDPSVRSSDIPDTDDTGRHGEPHWDYTGPGGPAHWGMLSELWRQCSAGKSQSPINIDTEQVIHKDVPDILFNYEPSELTLLHNGHTVQVNYDEDSHIAVAGENYYLVQFHFHTPSEHTIDGVAATMEIHFVHQSVTGKQAVVGVLVDEGEHNLAFEALLAHLPTEPTPATTFGGIMLDATHMLPHSQLSYRYQGSLTTPACNEGLSWMVLAEPIEMSPEQIQAFQSVLHRNSRPVQNLNGRPVILDTM